MEQEGRDIDITQPTESEQAGAIDSVQVEITNNTDIQTDTPIDSIDSATMSAIVSVID